MKSLTDFITALMRTPANRLGQIDPEKSANDYGIKVDVARHYLAQEKNRRASGG